MSEVEVQPAKPKKRWWTSKPIVGIVGLIVGVIIGTSAGGGDSSDAGDTTATGPVAASTVTVTAPPVTVTPAAKTVTVKAAVKEQPKGDTCEVVREAILTGSATELTAALKALQNDKSADATAREYAQNYLVRDKSDKDLRQMDLSIIQMSCS